jgi:hypothetical protein
MAKTMIGMLMVLSSKVAQKTVHLGEEEGKQ